MKKIKKISPILITVIFFVVLFFSMTSYTAANAYFMRRELMRNSYNKHQELYMKSILRGTVYDRNGTVLAESHVDENGSQTRSYPYGKAAAHVVGYAVKDKSGIEAFSNYDLLSTNASVAERVALAARGELFPGNNVISTIDAELQKTIYDAMEGYKGAVIVSNPKTGEILALCSNPSFDPENIEKEWDDLNADESSTSGGSLLINRATQGLYPVGSTFKIITTLAYLNANNNDYASYRYNCHGSFSRNGETIHCFNSIAHGEVDLKTSFALSCNSSFVNIGLITDRNVFRDTLKELCFWEKLPCDLTHNVSTISDPSTADITELMQLSIGQGKTLMTPLHMHMITAAIANDGLMMKPYLVSAVSNGAGKTLTEFGADQIKVVIQKEQSDILRDMMREVVVNGTGEVLKNSSYQAAGKTGSAEHREKINTESGDDAHAWFTGFAPYDNPEVCVTIILENAGSSSSYAVPLAKIAFDTYFKNK